MTVRELIGKAQCGTSIIVFNDCYSDSYSKPDFENHFEQWVLDSDVECVIPKASCLEIRFSEHCEDW